MLDKETSEFVEEVDSGESGELPNDAIIRYGSMSGEGAGGPAVEMRRVTQRTKPSSNFQRNNEQL
jgi:hypothetical protein